MKLHTATVFGLMVLMLSSPAAATDESQNLPPKKLRQHQHRQHRHRHAAKSAKKAVASPPPAVVQPAEAPSQTAVPVAANTGPDGYPQLPAVSTMLGSASQTLQSINSQAQVLEARVVQTQMENEAKMARQKVVFEQKLKSQEDKNRAVAATNQQLSNEIEALKVNISSLRNQAMDVQGSNDVMRTELKALSGRLVLARKFLLAALKNTDDSKAPQLAVLRDPTAIHRASVKTTKGSVHKVSRAGVSGVHKQQQLKQQQQQQEKRRQASAKDSSDDQDDDDSDEEIYLSLAAKVHREGFLAPVAAGGSPKDLLKVLGEAVGNLQKEEHKSEAQLKNIFLANFKAGVKRYASFMVQRRSLTALRGNLAKEQDKLRVANAHLQGTHAKLQQQLRSFGLFAQKLSHLALAPEDEASGLLKTLPQDVQPAQL